MQKGSRRRAEESKLPAALRGVLELLAIYGSIAASLGWMGTAYAYGVGPWLWGLGQVAILLALVWSQGGLRLFEPGDILTIGIVSALFKEDKQK